jgi:hypothetical protein
LSANTDKLAALVTKQEENTRACQAANQTKLACDTAHAATAQEIKETLAAITADQAQLAEDAKK